MARGKGRGFSRCCLILPYQHSKAVSEMRTRHLFRVMLLLLALAIACTPWQAAAEEASEAGAGQEASVAPSNDRKVLFVYDSLAIGTELEGNVEVLQRLLSAVGAQVTMQSEDGYYTGQMQDYRAVIHMRNQSALPPSGALSADLADYSGPYLHIGANLSPRAARLLKPVLEGQEPVFGEQAGKLAYVPSFRPNAEDTAAMAALLADWMGPIPSPSAYLLIKEMYPFSDLNLLLTLSDRLYEAGIPFMLAVRPVFNNLDQPAMKRYAQSIKYAQSRGASIVIQAPVVASTIARGDGQLKVKISSFIDVLAAEGVAPLGVVSELYWSFDSIYAEEGMSLFDSAVLLPDEKRMHRARTNESKPFSSSLFAIDSSIWLPELGSAGGSEQASDYPLSSAQTANMPNTEEELDELVERLIAHWMQYGDYRFKEHAVRTASHTIQSDSGVLLINGKSIGIDMEKPALEQIQDEAAVDEESLLSMENNILIAVIIVSLLIFGYLIYLGYQLYRRKYYK